MTGPPSDVTKEASSRVYLAIAMILIVAAIGIPAVYLLKTRASVARIIGHMNEGIGVDLIRGAILDEIAYQQGGEVLTIETMPDLLLVAREARWPHDEFSTLSLTIYGSAATTTLPDRLRTWNLETVSTTGEARNIEVTCLVAWPAGWPPPGRYHISIPTGSSLDGLEYAILSGDWNEETADPNDPVVRDAVEARAQLLVDLMPEILRLLDEFEEMPRETLPTAPTVPSRDMSTVLGAEATARYEARVAAGVAPPTPAP